MSVDATHGTGDAAGSTAGEPVPLGMPAFDAHRPPDAELVSDCVHCGFCLPTCPTYALWGEEMDSPRGRIHLMSQGLQGEPLSDSMVEHFDALPGLHGLRAGLPVGRAVRPADRGDQGPGGAQPHALAGGAGRCARPIFALFPYPRRLRLVRGPLAAYQRTGLQKLVRRSGVLQRLAPTLATMEDIAPPIGRSPVLPERVAARGATRMTVGMLTGCVQGAFFPGVNAATARVLAMEGCEVVIPRKQGCCGALSRAQRAGAGGAGVRPQARSTRSPAPASSGSWSTRPAAARP